MTTEADRADQRPSLGATHERGLHRSKYITPTSSFAGGRRGTLIFAAISGGSGEGLLRAHHDAVIKPLLKRNRRPTSHTSSIGVRLSHSNPRPWDVHGSICPTGDGVYDIALADKLVMRSASSCSFRAGAASSSETAIIGISRDTPGPIYDPENVGSSAVVPATRFSPADRFPVGTKTFGSPGPGHYNDVVGGDGLGAVSWTGVETFADSEWCSLQEHIDYGACLDGRCCTRHSVERKNALRVVQFLGDQGKGRGKKNCSQGQDQRRSRRASNRHRPDRNCDRGTVRAEGRRHQDPRPTSRTGLSSPSSSLSPLPSEARDDTLDAFSSTTIGNGISSKAETDGSGAGESSLRGDGSAGSSNAALNSTSSPGLEESGASCSSTDTGTLGPPTASADTSSREGPDGACSKEARVAGRKRTPLHFASERGELALVDRLCYQGDDRNAVDERGYTPLHDAAEQGNTRVVSRLLQGDEEDDAPAAGEEKRARGAAPERPRQVPSDPDVQDNNGRTPLYLACLRGHERAVRALLQAGASPDLLDKRGKPAQEVAGAQRIYQLLQYKADVSLVKSHIAALEERERTAERLRREAEQARASKELAALKKEELRLRAAVAALETKRVAYAKAAKLQ
eukprot:g17688.t1